MKKYRVTLNSIIVREDLDIDSARKYATDLAKQAAFKYQRDSNRRDALEAVSLIQFGKTKTVVIRNYRIAIEED